VVVDHPDTGLASLRSEVVLKTTMIRELYDALKSAEVDEAKARKAAETVASYEKRFA
jgi:hypothetical protein